MTAIAYELASNDGKPFGLRPDLMVFGGREAFWDELDHLAASGTVSGFLFHRLFGEPQAGDIFDWDARYQIEHSGDPALTDYAKHMARRLMRLATNHPDLEIDIYLGCMDHWKMQRLIHEGKGQEWFERIQYELALPITLIQAGCNVRIVFDASSGFRRYDRKGFVGPEVQILSNLARMYPNRIVVESTPEPGHPLSVLPSLCIERRYAYLVAEKTDWIEYAPHITRVTNGHDDRNPIEFVRECVQLGHKPVVSAHKLNRMGLSVAEFVSQLSDAGDPQGID